MIFGTLLSLLIHLNLIPPTSCITQECNEIKNESISRSGCCSSHGGVCGCGGFKLLCCDGTLSPSCRC